MDLTYLIKYTTIKTISGGFLNSISLINYQGSKKKLLDFIHLNTASLINPNETILDIFSGTSSVGYSFKNKNRIFANDSEEYAFVIANALLGEHPQISYNEITSTILSRFLGNYEKQNNEYISLARQEEILLANESKNDIVQFYNNVPTIWNTKSLYDNRTKRHFCFELFTTYYSSTYFGIKQAMEIDSLRFALDIFKDSNLFYITLSCLFYAMKQCVFSKDGHTAQPLNMVKNSERLFKQRKKSITDYFLSKLKEFFESSFVNTIFQNKVYNMDFKKLLSLSEIRNDVDFIYADPPYTDMQYSRYYHLLNIAANYNYAEPTVIKDSFTKGLYVNGRFQSAISIKQKCQLHFNKLIEFAKAYNKNLAISFAYPTQNEQKTDRYVMSIHSISQACIKYFGIKKVEIVSHSYNHSNNRNSSPKSVLEYLVLCRGR